MEIKAYGDRWRSWGIDHRVIKGNTSNPFENYWTELFRIKDEIFHNGMLVKAILIDSGDGEKTDLVYKFCQRDDERVFVSVKSVNTTTLTNKKFILKELDSYSGLYLLEIYGTRYFCKN